MVPRVGCQRVEGASAGARGDMAVETRARRRARDSAEDEPVAPATPWCSEAVNLNTRKKQKKISERWGVRRPAVALSRGIHRTSLTSLQEHCYNTHFSAEFRKKIVERKPSKESFSVKLQGLLVTVAVLLVITLWWSRDSTSLQLIARMSGADDVWPLVQSECCARSHHLQAALLRAEHTLRSLRGEQRRKSARFARKPLMITALPDVMEDGGGWGVSAQVGVGTKPWLGRAALWGVVPLWRSAPSPQTLLSSRRIVPADCWPFHGSRGEVIIELSQRLLVTALSVEHVRPDTARSAPRHFSLYGVLENGTWIKGVSSEYLLPGPARQAYPVRLATPVRSVVFRVLSNHGNTRYTCVYRVQVHGSKSLDHGV